MYEDRLEGGFGGGCNGGFGLRSWVVSHEMMTWSDSADFLWVMLLIRRWLFVNRRSRVFEPPDGVGLVPKLIF